MSKAIFTGGAEPPTPPTGKVYVFSDAAGQMFSKDDAGLVTALALPGSQSDILGGWRDLRLALVGQTSGAGTPTLTAFGPSANIKQIAFGVGDSVYVAGHIDHDIKAGSTVYPHVHWSTNGTNINTVKWQITCIDAAGHNQANFPVDTTILVEEAAHGTAWRHMITEDVTGFTAPEVDSLWLSELKRISNGGTDNTDTVFALFMDLHYEADRYSTVNRLPPFYS